MRALSIGKRCRHDGAELGAECARIAGDCCSLSWHIDKEIMTLQQ